MSRLTDPQPLTLSQFVIDEGPVFPGYHRPTDRWNGWACPFFTREVGDQIVAHFNADGWGTDHQTARYDAASDSFTFPFTEDPDEDDIYAGVDIDGLHLYAIGAWGWTWDEAEDDEARQSAIAWLVGNDPNGCYTDAACDAEDQPRLTLDEALAIRRDLENGISGTH